jgi:hypothetical protein
VWGQRTPTPRKDSTMADEVKVTDALNVGADQLLKVADGTLDGMIDYTREPD